MRRSKRTELEEFEVMDSKCEKCYYWQYIDSAFSDEKCCHFLLLTGHRKTVDEDGNCLSRKEE